MSSSISSLKIYDHDTNNVHEILEETQTQIKKQQRSSSLVMNKNAATNNQAWVMQKNNYKNGQFICISINNANSMH